MARDVSVARNTSPRPFTLRNLPAHRTSASVMTRTYIRQSGRTHEVGGIRLRRQDAGTNTGEAGEPKGEPQDAASLSALNCRETTADSGFPRRRAGAGRGMAT